MSLAPLRRPVLFFAVLLLAGSFGTGPGSAAGAPGNHHRGRGARLPGGDGDGPGLRGGPADGHSHGDQQWVPERQRPRPGGLRPEDVSVNSARGNLDFDEGGSAVGQCQGCSADMERNDRIYEDWQHNRNPFIDHPEWADSIWNQRRAAGALTRGHGARRRGYEE